MPVAELKSVKLRRVKLARTIQFGAAKIRYGNLQRFHFLLNLLIIGIILFIPNRTNP